MLSTLSAFDRFLVEEGVQFFDALAPMNGRGRAQIAVDLNQDIDGRSHRVAHGTHAIEGQVAAGTVGCAAGVVPDAVGADREGVELHGRVSGLDDFERGLGIALRAVATLIPGVGVDAQFVPAGAAQQFVDRHAQRLALDVPQRLIDGADAAVDHRSAALAPEGLAEEPVPHLLDAKRVCADQVMLGHILDHAESGRCARAVGQGHFAQSADPLVGSDLHDDRIPACGACVG